MMVHSQSFRHAILDLVLPRTVYLQNIQFIGLKVYLSVVGCQNSEVVVYKPWFRVFLEFIVVYLRLLWFLEADFLLWPAVISIRGFTNLRKKKQ